MKKIFTVTVGISAYNEEKNIDKILQDILSQRQKGWKLNEVLVYSDGSTDHTVEKVLALKKSRITVADDGLRKGKTHRIQQLFKDAKSDIIVMFDADVRITLTSTITHLVKAFEKETSVRLVGGNTIPYSPQNFFQKAIYSTFKVFYESRIKIRSGNNLFACTGGCLAIKKDFANEVNFPEIKNQDTYLYFLCKKNKYGFAFVEDAVVYYKLPNSLSDYLSQVFRSNPEAVQINLTKYFGNLVAEEYDRGKVFYFKNILKVFLEDPIPVAFIILINFLCRPFFRFFSTRNKATWNSVVTTK